MRRLVMVARRMWCRWFGHKTIWYVHRRPHALVALGPSGLLFETDVTDRFTSRLHCRRCYEVAQ